MKPRAQIHKEISTSNFTYQRLTSHAPIGFLLSVACRNLLSNINCLSSSMKLGKGHSLFLKILYLTLSLDTELNSFFSFSNSCSLVASNSSFLASLEDFAYRGENIAVQTINKVLILVKITKACEI